MEKKIYYFSGTGNSFYYAHSLAKYLNLEEKSINEETDFDFSSKTIVLCFPNYYGRLPLSVANFLDKIICDNQTKFYVFVSSYKGNGDILEKVDKILKGKNTHLSFGCFIKSPNNNIVKMWTNTKSEFFNKNLLLKGKDKILSYVDLINKEIDKPYKVKNAKPKKYNSLSDFEFSQKLSQYGDKFMITSECIRCRMCELNCERKNIDFLEGILVWKDRCEGCLKCINTCPYDAIEFEGITRGKRRYKNPLVSIDEYGFYIKDEENGQD